MRKTKIVCTLGPASDTYEQLKAMALAGMNIARVNMSHGLHEEHRATVDIVKRVREELKMPLPIMVDLKGPEVRIGTFKDGSINIEEGDKFIFTSDKVEGDQKRVSLSYDGLHNDVKKGDTLLLNDGLLAFEITKVDGNDIHTVALNSEVLSDRKGLSVPNVKLNIPFLSETDKRDLDFAVSINAEIIAASFVQNGECMAEIREYLASKGCYDMALVAKIESQEGINNIDNIIAESEGIMVARGDLGVEVAYEKLPAIQKMLILKSRMAGKFVITATEMLESMITKLRPTRAEIVDVANAVYDGTSCVMLSAESAVGINPPNTIATMAKIAREAESNIDYKHKYTSAKVELLDNNDAISHAAVNTSFDINAKSIVVYTASGTSARMVSRFRPSAPIIALTPNSRVYHQLATSWGVIPEQCSMFHSTDTMFNHAEDTVVSMELAQNDDNIVITAGVPLGKNTGTNIIKVEKIDRVHDIIM